MEGQSLLFAAETRELRAACFAVYTEKGSGFVESVYQECLEIEFRIRELPWVPQPRLNLAYKGWKLTSLFIPDFICYGKIIVELKAVTTVTEEHRAQVHNYLKATGHRLALLVNFGHYPGVEIERIIR